MSDPTTPPFAPDNDYGDLLFALARNNLETSITHGLVWLLNRPGYGSRFWQKFLPIVVAGSGSAITAYAEKVLIKKHGGDGKSRCDIRITGPGDRYIFVENKCGSLTDVNQFKAYQKLYDSGHKVVFISPYKNMLARNLEEIEKNNKFHNFSYKDIAEAFDDKKDEFSSKAEFLKLLCRIEDNICGSEDDWKRWYSSHDNTKGLDNNQQKISKIRYRVSGIKLLETIKQNVTDIPAEKASIGFKHAPSITMPLFRPGTKKDEYEFGFQINGNEISYYVQMPGLEKLCKTGRGSFVLKNSKKKLSVAILNWICTAMIGKNAADSRKVRTYYFDKKFRSRGISPMIYKIEKIKFGGNWVKDLCENLTSAAGSDARKILQEILENVKSM